MRPRLLPVLCFAFFCVGVASLQAQVIVWSGAADRFVTGTNWVGGIAPGAINTAQFGNHGGFSTIMVNSTTINHLEFLSTRTAIHNFSYDDGIAVLTLNGNFTAATGSAVNFYLNGSNRVDLALPDGEHVFNIGASTTVTIASLVTGTGHLSKIGAGTLVLGGANTLNYNGVGGFNNGVAVDGGTLELNGGSITQSFQDIIVGSVSGGTGTLLVTNGGDVVTKYGIAGNDVSTNATITVTGTGSTWTNSQGMALGYLGTGFLNVLAGGTVNTTGSGTDHSYLGLQSGTAGTAVVSGAGSAWTTPNDELIIGGGGTGNLTVSAGGLVSNTVGRIGYNASGIGTVTVNAGTWTNSSALSVGYAGNGTLIVENGGTVTSTDGVIAYIAGGSGSATIRGTGSAWTISGAGLDVGNTGTGSLTLANTGLISVGGGTGQISLGVNGGTGTLNLGAAAASAAAAGGIINAATISSGTGTGTLQFNTTATDSSRYYFTRDGTAGGTPVIVSGSTKLTQTAGYTVLTGTNTYTGGTNINGGYLLLGNQGTTGSITGNVTFGGSTAPGGGELQFLRSDAYAFAGNISGPGRVSNLGTGTTTLSGTNTYSGETFIGAGTLVDGAGNKFSPNSIMRINSGGVLQVNFFETIAGLADYTAGVGGTVNIASGMNLSLNTPGTTTFSGIIGSAGLLYKYGAGTQILAGANTYTGGTNVVAGTLQLTGSVTHGATDFLVNGSSGDAPALQITAGGDLTADRLRLGITNSTFTGSASVDGSGSTVTTNTYLYVGEAGFGELTVTNGGSVSSPNTSIGNNTGGEGQVLVSGAGSTLSNTGTLYVGSAGLGYLDILSGALVTNAAGTIGNNVGGSGSVYLDAGGTWNNSGSLLIGNAGTGSLDISGASTVTALNATLGYLSGIYGEVYVSGTGSTLSTTGNLNIGGSGEGALYVTTGADVITGGGSGVIANTTGSLGSVLLDGVGSTWTITGSGLYVGNNGAGVAYINNSSLLTVGAGSGTLYLGTNPGSSGQLYFGIYDIEGGDNAGILNAASITTSGGTGKVFFESTNATKNAPFYLTKDGTAGGAAITITGGTQVQNTTGYTVLTGANTYSGGTIITGGTLVAGATGALGTGTVQVNGGSLYVAPGTTVANALAFAANGGALGGTGTFGSTLTVGPNARLAPGNSVGTLNFAGGLTLAGGGAFDFEVQVANGAPGTGYDLVSISGGPLNITATSATPFTLKIISLDAGGLPGAVSDFSSSSPYAWTFATSAAGITGFDATAFTFNTGAFTNSLGIGSFFVTQSGNNLVLNFTPVPEPSTYALMLAGLGLAGFRRWRKRHA